MSTILETLRQEAEASSPETQVGGANNEAAENTATENPQGNEPATNDNVNTAEAESNTENADGTPEAPAEVPTKSFASEKAAKFDDFVRKTGKDDYKEFEFWQTPTEEVNEEELLRKYFSEKEGMTEKEIAFELKQLEKTDDDFDDDFGDSEDVSEKEILRERALRKAKSWHVSEFEKLSTKDSGQPEAVISERMTADEYNQMVIEQNKQLHQNNIQRVYETLPTIEGIELKLNGNDKNGIAPLDLIYVPDEEARKTLRETSEDVGRVINQFYDKGQLIDPKGWIELMSNVALFEKKIQFAVEQAVLHDRKSRADSRKNVTTDNYQTIQGASTNGEEAFDNWRKNRGF